jgi:hypothetical protein
MAITVSGPTIIFDDTSVAQASLYDETFGTGVFPEGGTSLTISSGTAFTSSATGGAGNIITTSGIKTDASVIFNTPQSGSITVNPIVSGVYIFAVGGGGGGGGCPNPVIRIGGSNGTPSFFSTVIGNGGSSSGTATGGAGGTATGGTTNTSGSAGGNASPVSPVTLGATGIGGNAGGFPNGISGAGGAAAEFPSTPFTTAAGSPGISFGGGGGGAISVGIFLAGVAGSGGGGGGLAIHSRLTITGGSPYSYQAGAPGDGGVGPSATGGAGGIGYLKFILYD